MFLSDNLKQQDFDKQERGMRFAINGGATKKLRKKPTNIKPKKKKRKN